MTKVSELAQNIQPYFDPLMADATLGTTYDNILRQAVTCANHATAEALLKCNSTGYLALAHLQVGRDDISGSPTGDTWFEQSALVLVGGDAATVAFTTSTGGGSFIRGTQDQLWVGYPSGSADTEIKLGRYLTVSQNGDTSITGNLAVSGRMDAGIIQADELRARVFVADFERVLAGSEMIAVSHAELYEGFNSDPADTGTAAMWVQEPTGFSGHVFADGDIVGMRLFERTANNTLSIGWAYGTVTFVQRSTMDGVPVQRYTFARAYATYPGTGSGWFPKGTLVIDFGTAPGGFWEVNAADGVNSPYARVRTFATHPGSTVVTRAQMGQLKNVTGQSEFGFFAGGGFGTTDTYVIAAETSGFQLHNMPLKMYQASTQTVDWAADGTLKVGRDQANPLLSFNGTSGAMAIAGSVTIGGNAGSSLATHAYADQSETDANSYGVRRRVAAVSGLAASTATQITLSSAFYRTADGTYTDLTAFFSTNTTTLTLTPGSRYYLYVILTDTPGKLRDTTSAASFDSGDKLLLAVAEAGADKANIIIVGGRTYISGDWINTGSITASQIKAATITTTELAAGAVTAAKIAASTITATELAAGAVTASKINVSSLSAIVANLGSVSIDSSGAIYTSGKTSYGDTDAGFWLGYDTSAYKLNIGSSTEYIKWDGSALSMKFLGGAIYTHATDGLVIGAGLTGGRITLGGPVLYGGNGAGNQTSLHVELADVGTGTDIFDVALGGTVKFRVDRNSVDIADNVSLFTSVGTTDFGGGVGVVRIQNVGTKPTTNPTSAGLLYAESGALYWRGSSGTETKIANA